MKIKASVVQYPSVFLDKAGTFARLESLTGECAEAGSQLVVFPESFIPGYPRGLSFGTTVGSRNDAGRALYAEYYRNSIDLEGEDRDRLEQLAARSGVYLVVGMTERMSMHKSLYCSMAYISPFTGLLGAHRKIKPTGQERVIWSEAGGTDLVTFDTGIGRIGGLICWENYMPLARMAMYQKGLDIYIAPTADSRPGWTFTMQHIALESRCYVLGCNQYFTKSMYPERFQRELADQPEEISPGGSLVAGPDGSLVQGPLYGSQGILHAELDLDKVVGSRLDIDVGGHYARPDIFKFSVVDQPETVEEDIPAEQRRT